MKYKVNLTKQAELDLAELRKQGNRAALEKINTLLIELETQPETGTGMPKQLQGDLAGFWSRRIVGKHRLIYSVHYDIVTVFVVSMLGHYYDK